MTQRGVHFRVGRLVELISLPSVRVFAGHFLPQRCGRWLLAAIFVVPNLLISCGGSAGVNRATPTPPNTFAAGDLSEFRLMPYRGPA